MYLCWFKVSFGQTFWIITCIGSKSTSCIILNIVYDLLNNIVYNIYIIIYFALLS